MRRRATSTLSCVPAKSRLIAGLMVGASLLHPVGLTVLTPSTAAAQVVSSSIRRGYSLLDQGLVDQAIAVFEQALRDTPQSVEGQLGLAIAYRRAGRDEDAVQAYERVLAIDPTNRLALSALGLFGGYRPEWQQRGIEALTTLLNLDPNDLDARAQRALLFVYQGRFADALQDYEVVLQRSPTPEVLVGAAQAYTYSSAYEQALSLFSRYQQSGGAFSPDEAIAYSIALRETGNAVQAIPLLEGQLRQVSASSTAAARLRGALASAYTAAGQVNQAVQTLAPIQGRPDSRLVLARAYSDLGETTGDRSFQQAAAELYRQVMTQTPALTAGIAREAAEALSNIPGEAPYALEIYRQLAQQYPSDRSLQVQQAVLERELGLLSAADFQTRVQSLVQPLPSDRFEQQIIAQALIRLDPPSPALLPLYQSLLRAGVNEPFLYFRVAQIFAQQREFDTAREALSAYAASPAGQRDPFASLLLLAEMDRQQGNLDLSAQRYETVLAANPTDSQVMTGALRGLAGVRQAQGRPDEAIALYDQAIARSPQDVALRLGRAGLAYQAGRLSEAEAIAVLNGWLTSGTPTDTPPELYGLVAALPADPGREALYDALLEREPTYVPIQIRKIQVIATRNPDLARAQVEQLIARYPDQLSSYFVQGQIAQDLHDYSTAQQAYDVILAADPANVDALLALGGVQFQRRQLNSAAQLYNRALAIAPNNPDARRALADLSVAQGRRLEALRQLEKWQLEQTEQGVSTSEISQQMQRIREGYLQQRGFQPAWERY